VVEVIVADSKGEPAQEASSFGPLLTSTQSRKKKATSLRQSAIATRMLVLEQI
jgi:hypothetical protein